jgi:hypothetical protein
MLPSGEEARRAPELNQPEWKLLSYFKAGISAITKLKSAIPERSTERNLVTEPETIK